MDGWQALGDFEFAAGPDQLVELPDNTGEPVSTHLGIVYDALSLVRLDLPSDDVPDDSIPDDYDADADTDDAGTTDVAPDGPGPGPGPGDGCGCSIPV